MNVRKIIFILLSKFIDDNMLVRNESCEIFYAKFGLQLFVSHIAHIKELINNYFFRISKIAMALIAPIYLRLTLDFDFSSRKDSFDHNGFFEITRTIN